MNRFWNILMQPIIEKVNANYIVEIGSDTGINTRNILDYCVEHDAHMTAIDPVPKFDIDEFKAEYGDRFEIYKELSLNRLPLLEDYDVILIDGDHNWYTVYNELKIIEKNFKDKKFPLIFLHDVGWPYGRRDLYYSPETIPEKYRQPYNQLGMYPDQTELKKEGGLNYMLNNALYENNSHNGVLTAIEDFIDESDSEFSFISVPAYFGLGILFPKNHEMEKEIKEIINELNLLKKHEKQILQLIIQRSELNNHIKKVQSQLIEKTNELKETHNKLQLTKKQFNDLASEMRKTQDDVQKLKSETDNLNNRIIETQYRNQKRPINQKLISWFPTLYMLLKINQTGLKNCLLNIKGYHALKKDKLFNIGYYLKNSADVKLKGKDPILHYIYHGFKEGRNPYPEFNTNYYIKTYKDVEQSKINPLIHYVLYGKKEKRQTQKTNQTILKSFLRDKFSSEMPLKLAFVVTEDGKNAAAGDYFTAMEFGKALEEYGWKVSFLSQKGAKDWYEVENDVDILISLLESYDLRKIKSTNKFLVKIAWPRNWFNKWVSYPWFKNYDIILSSSKTACHYIKEKTGIETFLLPIATNSSRFNETNCLKEEYQCDYCFTGSYWDHPRDIIEMLNPESIDYTFKVYGKNWEKVEKFKDYYQGFIEYTKLPYLYASTKIVIDDANIATKQYGSVNSRVFDALASGALVITNGELGAKETFNGLLPYYHSKKELHDQINYYLTNEEVRMAKVKELQKIILENHTYTQRAQSLKNVLKTYIGL